MSDVAVDRSLRERARWAKLQADIDQQEEWQTEEDEIVSQGYFVLLEVLGLGGEEAAAVEYTRGYHQYLGERHVRMDFEIEKLKFSLRKQKDGEDWILRLYYHPGPNNAVEIKTLADLGARLGD